ncbi:hypothetical protein GCM10010096_22390 [Alcaligenes pakistanensis]|uniref:Uncharacterized protein n=1 Tax=Alcaligenes pakistanensis TaxID=1482717 RepID=A0A8H9IM77_9BURK|nr:hypothetical protein GCM10010096_22390 [Alcaligenes pakistanensis]
MLAVFLGLLWTLCSRPDMQIASCIAVPEATLNMAVRYTRLFGGGLACRFLGSLLRCDGTGRAAQIFHRARQLLASFGMLTRRRIQYAIAGICHGPLRTRHIAFYRPSGRKPRPRDGLALRVSLRAQTACHQQRGYRACHRRQPVPERVASSAIDGVSRIR